VINLSQPIYIMLLGLNVMISVILFFLANHYHWVSYFKWHRDNKLTQNQITAIIVTFNVICLVVLMPSTFPIKLDWVVKSIEWLILCGVFVLIIWYFWQKRNRQLVESRNFYKIFKYIFTQLDSGALLHQTFKTVYHVVDDPSIKKRLMKFSVMLSQEHQISDAMAYLNNSFKSDEGRIFNGVMQNIEHNSMTSKGLVNVDQMLFQKYLSSIRAETKKIERQYILLIVVFTFQVMILLMLPLLSQMVESAQDIFK